MATQHATLTGTDLHEPKGAASANANEVYVANGTGSGSWTPLSFSFNTHIEDISSAVDIYIPIPYAGVIKRITTVVSGAVVGGDLGLIFYDSSSSSMGSITIASSGSAAGDVDTLSPASNNVVTANDYIRINGDGGPSSHTTIWINIAMERS